MTPVDGPPTIPTDGTASPARARAHRLWGGRFATASAPALEALNRSIGTDFRLWPFDVQLSKAWAVALWDAGVLTLSESQRLEAGLDLVGERLRGGEGADAADEDVHTMIDRMLTQVVGELGARLHTGRSRNDQVATATRLWCADAVGTLDALVRGLQQAVLDRASELEDALMPAYTHLQRAQPVSVAHMAARSLLAARARSRAARRGGSVCAGRAPTRIRCGGGLRLSDLARAAEGKPGLHGAVRQQCRRRERP